MNSDARKIATDEFAFASVNATPDLKPERSQSIAECVRASDRPGRAIKCGKKPVSSGANLASSVVLQNFPTLSIEFGQQFAPSTVANGCNTLRRSYNISKEHRSQQTLRLSYSLRSGKELFDLIENSVTIAQPRRMYGFRKFNQLCTRDVLSQITGMLYV